MSDEDHPLAAPPPAADEPLDAFDTPAAAAEERETAAEAGRSSTAATTVKAMADVIPLHAVLPRAP